MTDVSAPPRATDTGEAPQGPPRPRRGLYRNALTALVVALLAGLALGRFAFATSAPGPLLEPDLEGRPSQETTRLAALQEQAAADPQDLAARQELGAVATSEAIRTGDPSFYEIARQALDEADALAPDQPDTLVARGQLLLSLHKFPEALEVGQRAVETQPDDASALAVLVDAQTELGQYEEAADTLQRMADANPGVAALARISYQRELRGDLDGALLALRQAQSSAGSDLTRARVNVLVAQLLLRTSDVDRAARELSEAAALAPTLPDGVIGRAEVDVARGFVDPAITALSQSGDRLPVPTVLALETALQRQTGRTAEAADTAEVVRAVAELQQASGQVVDLEMALFEATDGDPERGLEYAEDAYDARPDNIFAADALAWARLRTGDVEGARPLVDDVLRLSDAPPATRVRMAAVLEAAGDETAAREQLDLAFADAPWTSLPERSTAVEVAARLGVEVPATWRPGSG